MSKLVSIIIPSFNRCTLIPETLDSIISQSYTNWECIIVDDGSTDATKEVVEGYIRKDPRFSFYMRPGNRTKGANACRNYGFELSKGEFINWFDSDDLMHEDKLMLQVSALSDSNYNFSICQTLVFENSKDNIIGLRHEKIHSDNVFEDYVTKNIIWLTQAPLWKKEFLIKNNYLFDEELQAAQEWEFHARILFNHSDYHVIDQPLVLFRRHSDSISSGNKLGSRKWNYYLARKKIYNLVHKSNNAVVNSYLADFFLSSYQYFLTTRSGSKSYKILVNSILFNKSFSVSFKIKMIMAFFSILLFNRGVFLFQAKPAKT